MLTRMKKLETLHTTRQAPPLYEPHFEDIQNNDEEEEVKNRIFKGGLWPRTVWTRLEFSHAELNRETSVRAPMCRDFLVKNTR